MLMHCSLSSRVNYSSSDHSHKLLYRLRFVSKELLGPPTKFISALARFQKGGTAIRRVRSCPCLFMAQSHARPHKIVNLIPLSLPLGGRKRRPPAWDLQLLGDGVGTVIAGAATDGPAGVAAGSTEVEALN